MSEEARKHATHNVSVIRKAAVDKKLKVVATSSSCVLTLREEYPNLLGVDNSDIRDSIVMASRYIFERLKKGATLKFREDYHKRIAYHTPCHMEKLGWSLFTRELMRLIPGLELVPLDSACCGIAGTYGFKKENYTRSQEIGAPLFRQIAEVAPDFIICECETCKWQIEMSTGVEVRNPISVLAEALDLEATAALNR